MERKINQKPQNIPLKSNSIGNKPKTFTFKHKEPNPVIESTTPSNISGEKQSMPPDLHKNLDLSKMTDTENVDPNLQ